MAVLHVPPSPHCAFVVHCTQVLFCVLQTGVAAFRQSPLAWHSTHVWVATTQMGVGLLQSPLVLQATQVLVCVLQMGVGSLQLPLPVHSTQV